MPSKRGREGDVFGPHLRALRTERNLTQQELADRSDFSVVFISNLERGVTIPSLSALLQLAEALECRVVDLVSIFDTSRKNVRRR